MLELRPGSHTVLTNLGITLFRLGRTDEARIQLERALTIDPEYELALAMLAELDEE